MPDVPRRLRTQAERDADGTELPPISYADQLIARHGQPMRNAIDRARVRYEADKAAAHQPRRRWWHSHRREIARIRAETRRLLVRMHYDRLTRRNP